MQKHGSKKSTRKRINMIKNSVYKIGGLFRCNNYVRYERKGQELRAAVAFGGRNTKLSRTIMIVPGEMCVLLGVDRIACKFRWLHPEHGEIFTRFTDSDFYDGRLFHKNWELVKECENP